MNSINDTTPSPAATRSDFATDLISAAALRWASCGFASLLRPSFCRSRRSAGCGAGAAEAPMEVDARLFWRQTSRAASTTANSSWGYAFGDELKTRGALEAAVAHDAMKSPGTYAALAVDPRSVAGRAVAIRIDLLSADSGRPCARTRRWCRFGQTHYLVLEATRPHMVESQSGFRNLRVIRILKERSRDASTSS